MPDSNTNANKGENSETTKELPVIYLHEDELSEPDPEIECEEYRHSYESGSLLAAWAAFDVRTRNGLALPDWLVDVVGSAGESQFKG